MDSDTFFKSTALAAPPPGLNVYLLAMWYDAKGDWQKAHSLVDSLHDTAACHVHAYLHRKEGDAGNAAYWYSRANKQMPRISLEEEWGQIVKTLV